MTNQNQIPLLLALAAAVAVAWIAAWALTGWSHALAVRRGIVSPVTDRSSHARPTPRLGGVGLALGFAAGAAVFYVLWSWLDFDIQNPWDFGDGDGMPMLFPAWQICLALGWAGMFGVGLLDDCLTLRPLAKLALMCAVVFPTTLIAGLSMGPASWPAVIAVALAVIWILFFTNAYNFMDGMDGFAATFARAAAMTMFAILLAGAWVDTGFGLVKLDLTADLAPVVFLLPVLAAACGGFLVWNLPPARVFMGDGGSLSVGYLLAVYPVLGAQGQLTAIDFGSTARPDWLASAIILLPFVFDVALTLIRRTLRGENILHAHREHLYQRLLLTGLTHAQVLRMNRRRFWACNALALAAALAPHRPIAWLCAATALALMFHYWHVTVVREQTCSSNPS